MGRKLVLSFSIIFVIIPFIDIVLFGGVYISDTFVGGTSSEMLSLYISVSVLSILSAVLLILYFFLFSHKITKAPADVKWLIISTFVCFIIYELMFFICLLEVLTLRGDIVISSTKILNAFMYLPMLLLPFLLIAPIFGFSKLYVANGSKRGNRIII